MSLDMYTYGKLILMCLDDIKPGRQTEIQRWVFGVDGLATPQKYMLGVRREQSSRQTETGGREIGREPEVESCWGCPFFNVFSRLLDNKVQGHLQHYHTTSMVVRKGMD